MDAANQALFDDKGSRDKLFMIAAGVGPDGVSGGMSFITEDKVRAGDVLYRVGHSDKPMTINMSSPWWMREDAFLEIAGTAERTGGGLQSLYRMKCAVSPAFGVADIVLRARVLQTLRCFTGRGRPVQDRDDGKEGQWWSGGIEIAQLFIPGLRDFRRGVPTPLCHASLEIQEKFKVSEFIRVRKGRIRKAARAWDRANP